MAGRASLMGARHWLWHFITLEVHSVLLCVCLQNGHLGQSEEPDEVVLAGTLVQLPSESRQTGIYPPVRRYASEYRRESMVV
jgi:hypothetical protein